MAITSTRTFDGLLGRKRKVTGIALAAETSATDLDLARTIAVEFARIHGTVTADDVGQKLEKLFGIKSLGPAAGALFRCHDQFEWTGQYVESTRATNHRRVLRVWRLK